ncbi:MAG TPA: sigma-70 family RNA polymerase sigma factor [Acidimicrobiales bacterium]|nr:sigma-70 family RNA polymerase sigma factor [Acidimicrobiales bacterium]
MWPDVAPALTGWLIARGFDRSVVEDAVQETAARVMAKEIEFVDAADLLRWARVVARNAAIDACRRGAWIVTADVPDHASEVDVEQAVLERRRLAALPAAFEFLSPAEQAELASTGKERVESLERRRYAVRLHRARTKLHLLVESLAAGVGWLARPRPRARAVAVLVPTAVLIAVIALHPSPHVTPSPLMPSPSSASDGPASRATATTARAAARAVATRIGKQSATSVDYLVKVRVPGPGGQPWTGVGLRPRKPEDHTACLDTIVLGYRCFDINLPGQGDGSSGGPAR